MAKLPPDKPGRYANHYEVASFSMSGIPDNRAQIVRREIEGRGRLGQVVCYTATDAEANRYETLRHFDGGICQIINFTSDGTKFDAALKCHYDNGVDGDVNMSGLGVGENQTYQFEVKGTSKMHPDFSMSYSGNGEMAHTGICTPDRSPSGAVHS